MATIKFTSALKRFYPDLDDLKVEVKNVNEVLDKIDEKYSGIKTYLVDDRGTLRKHINIFVDGELILDREKMTDTLNNKSEVFIMQALSGG
ncbi:MAG: molybdopterin converting factor small subunit [Granulosicoccus sp.]|jgi:molybdopterin converting factor small subunit